MVHTAFDKRKYILVFAGARADCSTRARWCEPTSTRWAPKKDGPQAAHWRARYASCKLHRRLDDAAVKIRIVDEADRAAAHGGAGVRRRVSELHAHPGEPHPALRSEDKHDHGHARGRQSHQRALLRRTGPVVRLLLGRPLHRALRSQRTHRDNSRPRRRQKFNTPNDLAVDRKGRVWFTNPWNEGNVDKTEQMDLDHKSVYCCDPQADGSYTVTCVTFDTTWPNGILVSAD